MRVKGLLIKALLLSLVLSVLIPAISCAPAAPVTPSIKIYGSFDMTAIYAPYFPEIVQGALDYFKYLNETEGGIGGHPVEVIWGEDGNILSRQVAFYKRFQAEGAQIYYMINSAHGEALKDSLNTNKVFAYNAGQSDPQLYPPGYLYIGGMSYGDNFGVFLKWVKEQWWDKLPAAEKERRLVIDPTWTKPRVGVVGCDIAYGRAPDITMTKYASGYPATVGVDYVGTVYPPLVPVDTTPALLLLIKDTTKPRVDWLFFQNLIQAISVAVKNMEALGLRRTDPMSGEKVGLASNWWNPADHLVRRVDPRLLDGYVWTAHYRDPAAEPDHPGVKKVIELAEKYQGGIEKVVPCLYTIAVKDGQFLAEIIRIAVEDYGYEGLTGENYMKAIEKIGKNWKTPWDLGAPFSIEPNDRRTSRSVYLVGVKEGKHVAMTDWMEAPHLFPAEYKDLFPGKPTY